MNFRVHSSSLAIREIRDNFYVDAISYPTHFLKRTLRYQFRVETFCINENKRVSFIVLSHNSVQTLMFISLTQKRERYAFRFNNL